MDLHRTSRPRLRSLTTAGVALAALGLPASPALAATSPATACVQAPTTQAFQKVDGDPSAYSPAPGGTFEAGAKGWNLAGGARVQTGNESLGVASGKQSLRMPIGSTATSPAFCVDQANPHFRFAYKVDSMTATGFVAYVISKDPQGRTTDVRYLSSTSLEMTPSLWKATPNSPLATILPGTTAATVQLKFVSINPVDVIVNGALTATNMVSGGAVNGVVKTIGGVYGAVANAAASAAPANMGISIDSIMIDPRSRS